MARRVLYFTDSAIYGGAEQVLLRLMQGLDRSQWRPALAYHPNQGLEAFLQAARQSDIQLLPVCRMPLGFNGALHMPALMNVIQEEQPDIFHANLSWPLACKWGLVAALLKGVPGILATLHLYVDAPYTALAKWQQRQIARRVSYIAVSRDVANKFSDVFHIPSGKIRVIPNAVATAESGWRPERIPDELSRFHSRQFILTVARLDKQKGHACLLEAAVLVPEAAFVLVGDGPERVVLEQQAAALGLSDRVLFAGRQENVPDWLAACDLFVLPSFYEGMPLSLLEAMASGKPVMATDIPGSKDVVKHGETGWLVPAHDSLALAEGMRTLLDDPVLASQLAQAGQRHVQQEFSPEKNLRSVTLAYVEALRGR